MQSLKSLKKKQKKIEKACLEFLKKRTQIVKKIRSTFFVYSKFKKIAPDFCPLYKSNDICHNVKKHEFDCWNCYCGYYDYKHIDQTKGLLGRCKRVCNKGKYINKIWDCSDCTDLHQY